MPYVGDGHRLFGNALQKILARAEAEHLLLTRNASLSFRVISRTAVSLLKVYANADNGRKLYRMSILALLQATDERQR